ncbi:hypothetical protein NDU88_006453 [Pleurodeles waltl]|uniref:LINE-1 type transposase domain-containing protein 1 n=1 Tax=Pleurodeles waltl TaxID=8319 RepID=A0AAV7LSL8_PLEWA|nr:hypothetical protein NDU88_006453 [Pleurodeles waltl]
MLVRWAYYGLLRRAQLLAGPRSGGWCSRGEGSLGVFPPEWRLDGAALADYTVAGERNGAIYYIYAAPTETDLFGGSGEALAVPATAEEPSCAELLGAIHGARVAMERKIETVAVEVNLLQADLRKISDKVEVVEGSFVDLQTEVGTLRKQMAQVTFTVGTLEARLEDSEGRSRRNNVRLLGFPERAEGSTVECFVEEWTREVLQLVGLSRVFVVERAHRALVAPPRPGAPQRAIIARLLNYKDMDCILQTARETDRAIFENCKISIYPDYTNKVKSSRKGFLEVKAKLRAMNIRYMLLYPARLKVFSRGKSQFFDHPEEVQRWREMWDKVGPGPSGQSGVGSARTSGVNGTDWRRSGDGPLRVSAQRFHNSVSRI